MFEKKGNRVVATSLDWVNQDKNVGIKLDFDAHAIYSEKLNEIAIENYQKKNILFYSELGKLIREIPLPCLEGHSSRGLNKNNESKSGISLIFFPTDESKKTKWDDMVQYELLLEKPFVGKYLNIYR
jgi:hypothetical protein